MGADAWGLSLFESPILKVGNYEAQRQLDYRLTSGSSLRIIAPPIRCMAATGEDLDFKLAMARRNEPAGATLDEIGKKYGLQ